MAAKILVVDDDPNVQRLLQYTLKQEGYEVVVASDGAEGFRLWGAEAPDLILLDVMLPELDGYQVATKIRTEEGTSGHVPIIMLTAEREVEQKVRGAPGRRGRLPDQAVPPGRADGPDQEPARPVRPRDTLVGRPPLGRVLALYGAKGGVGTTTIAINAAIALHRELGRKVALIDGNLQFGDHRVFLDLGLDRKSIVDIVTAPSIDQDLIRQVFVKHDSGVDLLLAPPSPETAELVTPEHIPAIIDQLRGLYDYILIDIDKRLDDINLGVLEVADTMFVVMTADLSCLKNVRLVLETIGHLGYESSKVQLVLNRSTRSPASTSRTPRALSSGPSSTRSSTSTAARSARSTAARHSCSRRPTRCLDGRCSTSPGSSTSSSRSPPRKPRPRRPGSGPAGALEALG